MAVAVEVHAFIDWSGDGDFGDTGEAIDDSRVLSVAITRGRASVNDEFSPGMMQLELDNQSGDYSPFNTSSALSGSILPGRAVLVQAEHNSNTYDQFYGYITDYVQSRAADGRPTVVISALDGLDVLRFGNIRLAMQTDQRVDELIDTCLDEADWSMTLRDLDMAVTTVEQFWVYRVNPLEGIRRAAKQELGGQLFIGKSGKVTFRNRDYRSSQVPYATVTGPQALSMEVRRDDLYDEIHHARAGLSTDSGNTVVYTLIPAGRRLAPGTADPLNTIYGALPVGAASLETPVANTDYVANSQADGGGTDKTNQVVVDSFDAYGGGFTLGLENLDSSDVFLTLLQVRGVAVRRSNEERKIEVAVPSPIVSGQTLVDSFDYNDDAAAVSAFANFRSATYATVQPRPTVRLIPADDTEMAAVLDAEMGKLLTITNTTGLYPTELDEDFFIERISLRFTPGPLVEAEFVMTSRDQGLGSFFRISSDDSSAEYSVIAEDAAVVGDRVAF